MKTPGPTLAQLEAQRGELAKQIQVVVGQLAAYERGHSLLSVDTKHRLELQLLTLEQQNTAVVAEWVVLRQAQDRQAAQRATQTTLFPPTP